MIGDNSIHTFKKQNREFLFNKLKNWGCGFEHLKYKSDRCLKIGFVLNEGLIGWTKTPLLKDDIVIHLLIYVERIDLVVDDEIVKSIPDWHVDIEKTFRLISYTYDNYFYYTEEVMSEYKGVWHCHELESALDSMYPTIRIRKINKEHDYFSVWAGAGEFTFLLEKKNGKNDKIEITTYYYGKGSPSYQKDRWNIPLKYSKIVNNLNLKPVYNYNLAKLVKIYEKCKNL
jgi:hypothetical protein